MELSNIFINKRNTKDNRMLHKEPNKIQINILRIAICYLINNLKTQHLKIINSQI